MIRRPPIGLFPRVGVRQLLYACLLARSSSTLGVELGRERRAKGLCETVLYSIGRGPLLLLYPLLTISTSCCWIHLKMEHILLPAHSSLYYIVYDEKKNEDVVCRWEERRGEQSTSALYWEETSLTKSFRTGPQDERNPSRKRYIRSSSPFWMIIVIKLMVTSFTWVISEPSRPRIVRQRFKREGRRRRRRRGKGLKRGPKKNFLLWPPCIYIYIFIYMVLAGWHP